MEPTDAEIVRRVREGEVDAYRVLVDRYYARSLRFAMRMLGNRADAEEAVQDAFIRAHKYLGRFREQSKFTSWLMQIVVNECRTLLSREERLGTPVGLDLIADFHCEDGGEHDGRDLSADLSAALARLDPQHREAIILKYAEDLTYEDMADVTGLRVSALKMRVKRAREHLEALLWEMRHE